MWKTALGKLQQLTVPRQMLLLVLGSKPHSLKAGASVFVHVVVKLQQRLRVLGFAVQV
jgi:hypothetical protein